MAAVSNATTATQATHHINAEIIEALVAYAVQRPYVWQELVYTPDLRAANTAVDSHPIVAQLSAAGAHTETDEVASATPTRTNSTITTAEYAKATFLGDRARRLSILDEDAVAVNRLIDACQLEMDTAVLTLASSMSNSIGDNATVHNVVNFNTAISTFRTQIGSSTARPVFVHSVSAIRDLHEDAATNAAAIYGSLVGVQLHDATSGVNQGLRRPFGNIDLIETAGVVAGDTSGKANFITLVGGPGETALRMPIGKDVMAEVGRVAERIGQWLVASYEKGAGIFDNSRCLRVITRA